MHVKVHRIVHSKYVNLTIYQLYSKNLFFKKGKFWGAWVAQSVGHPTSAQVMISKSVSSSPASGCVLTAQSLEPVSDSLSPSVSDPPRFMGLSPASGCVLTAQSLEPALDSVSPSLSAPSPLTLCLSVSQIQINILKKEEEEEEINNLSSHLMKLEKE